MVISALRSALHALIASLQFLTRIPIPAAVPFNARTVSLSAVFFPFAGLLIGVITVSAGWLLQHWIPAMPLAVLLLAWWIALSGGLHLDGWMDTADGVLSHRSRERMLEIMRDSRVGAMGVIAGVLLLLLKFSLLADMLAQPLTLIGAAHFIAITVWSRWWMAIAIGIWPYVRADKGMGSLFCNVRAPHLIAATGLALAATIALYATAGLHLSGAVFYALCWALSAALFGLAIGAWLHRKLGGQTGDTYGAMNEALEAMLLLALIVAAGHGFV